MALKFSFTPDSAQEVARAAAKWLVKERGPKVFVEHKAWENAPYRTTLVTGSKAPAVLIEAQGEFSYEQALKALAIWLRSERHFAELYIAVSEKASVPVTALHEIRRDGVGLLTIGDDGKVRVTQGAQNPALLVTPEPTLVYGNRKHAVLAAIEKFNTLNRKDGLRDLCEIFEDEVNRLIASACRKGRITKTETELAGADLSTRINLLASPKVYPVGAATLIDEKTKDDLHSFRGARNLVDHPTKTAADERNRSKQYHDRMSQGPRLIATLVAARRKVERKK